MKCLIPIPLATIVLLALAGLTSCADSNASQNTASAQTNTPGPQHTPPTAETVKPSHASKGDEPAGQASSDRGGLSEGQWRAKLTAKQFRILRNRGTEQPFANKFYDQKQSGLYRCAGCGQPLFSSENKFHSGTGWPSFTQPIASKYVRKNNDTRGGMVRTEVLCSRCGGHLGHIFHDGPAPTGLRYCVNSAAMTFEAMDNVKIDDHG